MTPAKRLPRPRAHRPPASSPAEPARPAHRDPTAEQAIARVEGKRDKVEARRSR